MKIKLVLVLLFFSSLPAISGTMAKKSASMQPQKQTWWKEAIVYQIYPRSFKDSNGDGIGDLKGIISKLDYIKSLGINVVWLNPIYGSPNDDNGYDISDYRNIMKEFGTMADFDALLKGMHQRGIKMVLDLVVNHSSDEHEWFKQSRSSRTNPYRDYYHWWPAEKGKPATRWSYFDVNGDAWMYDKTTDAYYLHYFSRKQPDLNWENPKLRQEIYNMMRFWFDKGIDGFRMDVIPYISKDTTFPPIPEKYHGNYPDYYAHGPYLHQYLQEMNREVLSKYNIMTVAEGAGVGSDEVLKFVDPARKELNMLYHFEGTGLGYLPDNMYKELDPKGYCLVEFKKIYSKWDSVLARKGWGTIYLTNHDQPRMVSRWGNDSPAYRELSSKMLTTFLFTMRGTPYYFAGDELGMSNIKFDNIEDYRDIETINMYQHVKNTGGDLKRYMEASKAVARDNSRTPFQWNNQANAGFTDGTPWLKVNPNYTTVNVAAEENDPGSCLNYFRKIVNVRATHKGLIYGQYRLLDKYNPDIYAYTRTWNGKKYLVLLNFTTRQATTSVKVNFSKTTCLIDNYKDPIQPETGKPITLRPYEAAVLDLQ